MKLLHPFISITVLVFLTITGCEEPEQAIQTPGKPAAEELREFIGKTEAELIERFGPPDRVSGNGICAPPLNATDKEKEAFWEREFAIMVGKPMQDATNEEKEAFWERAIVRTLGYGSVNVWINIHGRVTFVHALRTS